MELLNLTVHLLVGFSFSYFPPVSVGLIRNCNRQNVSWDLKFFCRVLRSAEVNETAILYEVTYGKTRNQNACGWNHERFFENYKLLCMISGFRREVAEKCALLGYYAASSGNFFDVSGQPIGPIGKKLPLLAA